LGWAESSSAIPERTDTMPYVTPGELLALQRAAVQADNEGLSGGEIDRGDLERAVERCVVCGSEDCTMKVVQADGVHVHRQAVANADDVEVPEL